MAQTDQIVEQTGPRPIAPKYAAQQTLQYKTFLKRTMVEALQNAFKLYADPSLLKTKIAIDYTTDRAAFPAIIVKFYEQTIKNAGVGHSEWGPENVEGSVVGSGNLTAGSGEITGLPSVEDLYPTETQVLAVGLPQDTFVLKVLSATSILVSKPATVTGPTSITFRGPIGVSTKFIEYHHSIYHGDVALEVIALSSVDRDKVSDALIEVVQMGNVGPEGISFQERIYDTIGLSPYSDWHFIAVNSDLLSGYGEREEMAPWMAEDVWVYRTEYRVPIIGEFYSVTPKTGPGSLGLVQEVDLYPWNVADPFDTQPENFPGGVVPKSASIPITAHAPKNPYHIVRFIAGLGSSGSVAHKP